MSAERNAKRARTGDAKDASAAAAGSSAETVPGQGFGNYVQTEALPGALPPRGNTPQRCPYGLYAEQLSGTSFTTPRLHNQRSWLYRIRPSADHGDYERVVGEYDLFTAQWTESKPDQFRWMPPTIPAKKEGSVDFLQGLVCYGGCGDPALRTGFALYVYAANASMEKKAFFDSDGDLMIVPEHGELDIWTEFGRMVVKPHEIVVIPRGVKFSVATHGSDLRGYVCEVFEGHFELPELGPIGANGLANHQDFSYPAAAYMEGASGQEEWQIFQKFNHTLHKFKQNHTPFDVVAWRGNYAPYKYDLDKFCVINSVSYDHIDPSIFTVMTCPTARPGVAVIDFVIFPPRWGVASDTFRPPYYHRNCMTEFMGMVAGEYEAKPASAGGKSFGPGGATLHSCMSAHGPAAVVFEKASTVELKPERVADNSLAFMFESHYIMQLTKWAIDNHDPEYRQCWNNFKAHFKPEKA